jgi:hypothetical protein
VAVWRDKKDKRNWIWQSRKRNLKATQGKSHLKNNSNWRRRQKCKRKKNKIKVFKVIQ